MVYDNMRVAIARFMGKGSFQEKFEIISGHKLIARNDAHDLLPDGKKRFYGIPQGLAISALLSNIYLIDYDQRMQEKAAREGFLYRRYCDDILIVCDTDRALDLQKEAIREIEQYHLEIQDRKVELIEFCQNAQGQMRAFNLKKIRQELPSQLNAGNEQRFYKNLQYLGFEFNGKDVFIRTGSISRYHRKASGRVIKTVCMAYSERGKGDRIFKQQLFHRYTHLGKRNFPNYVYKAAKKYYKNAAGEIKPAMESPAIRKQLSKHVNLVLHKLGDKNEQRALHKAYKGKLKRYKKT